MNAWAFVIRQCIATLCVMCCVSLAHSKEESGLDSLEQLVMKWKEGVATGDLGKVLPLYVGTDQEKVANAFAHVQAGRATLPFAAEVVNGRWFMRADELQWKDVASAKPTPPVQMPVQTLSHVPLPVPLAAPVAKPVPSPVPAPTALLAPPPVVPVPSNVDAALNQPAPGAQELQIYAMGLTDQNFRRVLMRWAVASDWMFEPEHWALTRDIPVSGADSVRTDFKTAVRRLLRSSLLTDLPVQPCFYSNKVLRVIPASELCARTEH